MPSVFYLLMFYANNHYIMGLREHSRSYFIGHYCFSRQMNRTTVDSVTSEIEVRLKQYSVIDVASRRG